jgi:branched-subunit amino acid aminotransferase/4-amino-4-deoxychorismate lyase
VSSPTPARDVHDLDAFALPTIWINGQRQPPGSGAHVSARDRGLTLADGLFETMRCRNGRVFRLDRHLARLEHGLVLLGFPSMMDDVRRWIDQAVGNASSGDRSVRVTVTRGIGAGVAPPATSAPTVVVTVAPMPAVPRATYEAGLTAHVASGRFNNRSMTAGLKTLAYTDAVAAMVEAIRAGAEEALFLDADDHCCEATASNLFIWDGRTVITPPLSCGVLPGVTRAAVLELAAAANVPTAERAFGLPDLLAAHEAFLTSSLRGIAPLVRVDARPIGSGTPGPHTRRFADAYRDLVDLETR